jgi:poly-gamma-glutamate capsule biosynthesis protein CapA/YwtB (metallophosphatase superfamily)
MKRLFIGIAILTLLLIFVPINTHFFSDAPDKQETATQVEPQTTKVRLAAFGDIMMHTPQIQSGNLGNGKYDFRKFFKEIKPYIEKADIAVGNLELTLAGPSKPYSGYPLFNAPDEIVDALKDAGVDAVSTANNHAMDTGVPGVIRTYQVVKEKGIEPFGTAPSEEERKPLIIEKNGIKFGFLAYTEHTNGNPVPKDKPYLINRINIDQIKKDIKKAREMGAEFVCVSLHWGQEYMRQPNDFQKETAKKVLEAGADAILGSHPHVLQRIEKVNVGGKEKLLIYSLGNFISNQFDPYTDEGVIVYFDVEKDPKTKEVKLTNVSFLPTFVHKYSENGKPQYVIIPEETAEPVNLPKYPGLTESKWQEAYQHTYDTIRETEAIPAFASK